MAEDINPKDKEEIKKVVEEVLKKEQQGQNKPSPQDDIQQGIVNAANAHNLCLQTLNYCLNQGANFTDPENFKRIQDCSEICDLAVSFMLRDSPARDDLLKICQRACQDCVTVCERFDQDTQMQACGKYVNLFKESCGKILSDDFIKAK